MKILSLQDCIKFIVAEDNMNPYRLAKILDCSSGHIYNILNGKVKSCNCKLAMNIYKYFDILVDSYNTVEQLKAIYTGYLKGRR